MVKICMDRVQSYCTTNARLDGTVRVSETYTSSFYTTEVANMNTNILDPSLTLAFTCRLRDDFKYLLDSI